MKIPVGFYCRDQAIIRNSVAVADVLGMSANNRQTIKQVQFTPGFRPYNLGDFPYICFVDLLLYSTPRQDEARDEDEKSISQRMAGLSPAAALPGQLR